MSTPPNPDELAKYVQWRLAALGEENAHHRFEELCFRAAKATVASNLVPPTGPVSAGGDQGRDFESYRIDGDGGNVTRIFAAMVKPNDTLLFACTTQKGSDADLARKARSDVDTAMARAPKPTVIYYYCSSVTMAPTARHTLQDWARSTHDAHLEVVDQRALAEILVEKPNRWLAQHYLAVPSEMLRLVDEGPAVPGWYDEAKERLRDPQHRQLATHAEFDTVVRCARHAWTTEGLERDDGLWLDVLSDVWGAEDGFRTEQGLRAFYETFVYLLRGRDRCGLEAHIPEYVDGIATLDDLGLSTDAQCFATYLVAGVGFGHIALEKKKALALFERIVNWFDEQIGQAPGPVVEADLLVSRGSLVIGKVALADERPSETEFATLATETLGWWSRALDVGERLVSFPLLRLGDLVANAAPFLSDSPRYDSFVARLDAASEPRLASEALAATKRDRAMSLFKADRFLAALPPLLAARRHWHNGDRIRGSLLASLLAAQALQRLGLLWAAKRTLLDIIAVTNRVGAQEHGDLLTSAVFSLAELDYLTGDWAASCHFYRAGLILHAEYAADPWNLERHEQVGIATVYLVNMLVGGEVIAPGFREWGEEVAEGWDLGEELKQFGAKVRQTWSDILDGSMEVPFHDSPLRQGAHRRARWEALGLAWEIRWEPSYGLESSAIDFIGILQFIIAGLAKSYRHLLPSRVRIDLAAWDEHSEPVEFRPGNDGVHFEVRIPPGDSPHDPTKDGRIVALVAASRVLRAVSVDPNFEELLHEIAGSVISDAMFVGARPAEGLAQILPEEAWSKIRSAPTAASNALQVGAHSCEDLPWPEGLSPAFDEQEAGKKLRARYEGGFRSAAPVLEAHGESTALRRLVEDLQREGWLDWMIASALAPAAISDYANHLARHGASNASIQQMMRDSTTKMMGGTYAAPPWSASLEQAVRQCIRASLVNAVQVWDLQVNCPTPDLDALRAFLDERFRHFTDDLPPDERDLFPWE